MCDGDARPATHVDVNSLRCSLCAVIWEIVQRPSFIETVGRTDTNDKRRNTGKDKGGTEALEASIQKVLCVLCDLAGTTRRARL